MSTITMWVPRFKMFKVTNQNKKKTETHGVMGNKFKNSHIDAKFFFLKDRNYH